MTWGEFCALLSGLGEDTPLARTVQIRLEDDPKVLESFTSAQHRIRSQWRAKHTSVNRTTEERDAFLRELEAAFASSLSKEPLINSRSILIIFPYRNFLKIHLCYGDYYTS